MPRKARRQLSVQRIETPPSRNRNDILEEIKGEELLGSSVSWDGSLVWFTTPEELRRLAEAFKKYRSPGEGMFVQSYGGHFSLYRPGYSDYGEWETGVEVRNAEFAFPPTDVELFTFPAVLKRFANRLEKAPWEKQKPNCVYGSDRKIIRMTVGDHIVTTIWTPPFDQVGVPQISEMHWGAWDRKMGRRFAEEARKDEERGKHILPFRIRPPRQSPTVYGGRRTRIGAPL